MGLIKAAKTAASGILGDQWKEYFYCEAIPADILVCKGRKRTSNKSSNRGADNIISNGSVVAVADGQCMMIVEQGKIVEFCAEPGEFVFNNSTEGSVFAGDLGESIGAAFATFGKRFGFGGDAAKDQRVYYFNTKEIPGNKYGTPNPVPFRVVDMRAGLDMDVGIRCFGEYSYRIANPMAFYVNVCGNVAADYDRARLDSQLKTELLTALQPAFAKLSEQGIRYSALTGHTMEIADALNEILSKKWGEMRGIEVVSFGVSSLTASEEDEAAIKEYQRAAALRDPGLAAAHLAGAQAAAMQAAAKNANGAVMGFAGLNMANQAGGMNAQALYGMASQSAAPAGDGWKCTCGHVNTGNFCAECGAKRPEANSWTCACGHVNTGNFCAECGAKKPAGKAVCASCGWTAPDAKNPPKFCPECGTPFGK